ncbi:methionine adenosyltransferase [Rufibacter latericius]|uniref:S-adenosylmethionine synthase n=1 Tax=Rufibacter latericius TaxID=2487040 RepID=A0A3M9MKW7_9BACT|nr:methionine adenosyltransferase [Rufibacter latericius]RNI26184.1 methionine adenosyltransferase [Rufibacter latericius]
MPYLFTSESVSEGHPDKVADQISDALLDEFLKQDPQSKVACETLVTTGLVVLSGEVKSDAYVDVQKVARDVIRRIGYTKSEYKFDAEACGVISTIHEQSGDINQGVERENPEDQGAGDQGMMFGYATNETDSYMPLALEISHLLLKELAAVRKEGKEMTYLRPDAKSQVTIRYSDTHVPEKIDTVVISTQHDEFESSDANDRAASKQAEEKMVAKIKEDVLNILLPRVKSKLPQRTADLFADDITYHINPTGKFVIGGPHGDTGLTGRKIIVDTYGGKGAHGGGAFSGKDSSKVDRSAAYAARHIAKNLVAAGVADQALVQVAYAIGVAEPVGLYVTTYGTTRVKGANGETMTDGEIANKVNELFEMRPYDIIKRFGLQNPIFGETAAYGHMGRESGLKQVTYQVNGKVETREFETFTWEKLDYVDKIKAAFNL